MAEKNDRTTAKRKFTLERKNLVKLMQDNEYIEILTNSFTKLDKLWKEAQDANETYLRTLSVASDDEGEDEWIINLQTNFRNAEKAYYEKVIQSNGPSPPKIYKNDDVDGSTQHKLFTERTLKEMKFSNSVTILQHMFKQSHSNESMKVVNEEYKTMKQCYEDVEKAHEAYVLSLGSDTAAAEMNWIVKIREIIFILIVSGQTLRNRSLSKLKFQCNNCFPASDDLICFSLFM